MSQGSSSALAVCLPFLSDFLRVEPGGLFSFGRLAPVPVTLLLRFDLFFGSTRGDLGLPFLGLRLFCLLGLGLVFWPGYLEAVLNSSFFGKGIGTCPKCKSANWDMPHKFHRK